MGPKAPLDPEPSAFKGGCPPILDRPWYTDGSSRGAITAWTAVAVQPSTDTIWFETGCGQSSQWAELSSVDGDHQGGDTDSLADLEVVAPLLWRHLAACSWAVNKSKVQRPGSFVKFLGVIWSGKTKAIPETIVDKIQAYLQPTTMMQLQIFVGLLGYWWAFMPHLAQMIKLFHHLSKKGATWDWNDAAETAFLAAKWAIQQA